MSVALTWINHASFRLAGTSVVYIDPWKLPDTPRDGDVVFISHSHHDHFSAEDVDKAMAPGGEVVAPADVIEALGRGRVLRPGDTLATGRVVLTGVPAYNVGKRFHPRQSNWLGAIIEMDGVRVYYAGDTDATDEMAGLENIDVALLPVGGTYTMTADEAGNAAAAIGCQVAVPYHFGDIVGSAADARRFADAAPCKVHVLSPGESIEI